MPVLFLDHREWEGGRHYWRSQREFLGGRWSDGLHSIDLDEYPLDILIVRPHLLYQGHQRVLPVLFTTPADSGRTRPPYLYRPHWLDRSGVAALYVSDPVLSKDPTLKKGWFADGHSAKAMDSIAKVLLGISDRYDVEPLLMGGATAGFAALRYGSMLGEHASVLVWNPELIPRRNVESVPRASSFVSSQRDYGLSRNPARASTRSEMPCSDVEEVATKLPKRLVLLQQRLEPVLMRGSSGPLIAALSRRHIGAGHYVDTTGKALCVLGNWEPDSCRTSVPPFVDDLLQVLIRCDSDWRNSVLHAVQRAVSTGIFKPWDPLRFLKGRPTPRLLLDCHFQGDQLLVKAELEVKGVVRQPPQYAFYVISRGRRIQMRWYESEGEARFPILHSSSPDQVIAFAIDGLGTVVSSRYAVRTGKKPIQPLQPQVFIVGSCVSRDIFSMTGKDSQVAHYVARSSLASALYQHSAPERILTGIAKLKSAWQKKMVQADVVKQLPSLLQETDFTLLLLDLVDERFRVALVGGVPVTVSSELLRSGFSMTGTSVLSVDDERRMEIWRTGVERLLNLVQPQRIVLNRVYWASHDTQGRPLDKQEEIVRNNRILGRMYAELMERYPFRTIDYPPELLVADPQHRWGLSPFHFVPAMYSHALERLLAAGDSRPAPTRPSD